MGIISKLSELFGYDIGIDLGSSMTRVWVKGKGLVLDEPSVACVSARGKRFIAASRYVFSDPPWNVVTTVRPIKEGVISDYDMAVGFVVLLGMVSLCGLKGDGNEKIDALFAPLRDWETVYDATKNSEHFASNAIPAAAFSCILPQRYFFNIGRVTFEKDWSNDGNVQRKLRDRVAYNLDSTGVGTDRSSSIESNAVLRYNAYWATDNGRFIPETKCNIAKWIKGWGCGYPTESEQKCYFAKWEEEELKPFEVVNFLRHHPEHRKGWKVAAHRKHLLLTLGMETLPLIFLNVLCIAGTLLAVWKKQCYQQLR